MTVLEIENLTRYLGGSRGLFGGAEAPVRAEDGVSLTLETGTILGVAGESGCGKGTPGRIIAGLDRPTPGQIRSGGTVLTTARRQHYSEARRRAIQLIFQDPYASLNPRMTVDQALSEPIRNFGLACGRRTQRIAELLDAVGLARSAADKLPHEVSGGQRQRIGIARALAAEPEPIVADEAVSALDVSIQAQIVNLLAQLRRDFGLAILFISHDMALIEQISDRVAVMCPGQIGETGSASDIFRAPSHPYTQALTASTPDPDPRLGPIVVAAQGEIPSPRNPTAGCRYHTRCPLVFERCRFEVPALQVSGKGTVAACHQVSNASI